MKKPRRRGRRSAAPPATEPFERVVFAPPRATADEVFRAEKRAIDRREAPADELEEKYRVVEFRARGSREARLGRAERAKKKLPAEMRLPLGPVGAVDLGVRETALGPRREWLLFGFSVPARSRRGRDEKLLKILSEEVEKDENDLDAEAKGG